jgi:glycosyltransferase involved in cell wall biosynthesis
MRIIIIEPEFDGHYIVTYVKFVIDKLSSHKIDIIVITSEQAKKHLSLKIIKKAYPKIKVKFLKYVRPKYHGSFFLLLCQIKLYFLIKKTFSELSDNKKIDKVFVNSIDHFDKALAILGDPFKGTPFVAMYNSPKFHFHFFNFTNSVRFKLFSKYLFERILKMNNLVKILVNDHLFIKYIKIISLKNINKIKFFFHPVKFYKDYSKKISYKKLELPKNSIPILVYGYLRMSKGIIELLNALSDPRVSTKLVVILAGNQVSELRKILQQKYYNDLVKKKKLFIYNYFHNEKDEAILFSAAKIVWVAYNKTPFASGVLIQAAVKRIPVIATDYGIIGDLTSKYNLGVKVNIDIKNSIIKALNNMCYKKYDSKFLNKNNKNILIKNSKPKFFMNLVYNLLRN